MMLTKWRLPMLGAGAWLGVWLYLGVVGVLWGATLSQHQKVIEHWRTYLEAPEAPPLPAEESPNPAGPNGRVSSALGDAGADRLSFMRSRPGGSRR